MSAGSEFTGTLEAVEQEAPDPIGPGRDLRVPVVVEGVVPVQITGSRAGASFSKLVTNGDAVMLAGADQRRRVVQVISTQNVYIGTSQAAVAHGTAALWPLNVACPITHQDEVWVKPTADATISAMVENWAD